MVRVKICGVTSVEDARLAVAAGADAVGLVFADSPRRVQPDVAAQILPLLGPFVTPVALFVDAPLEDVLLLTARLGVSTVQLQGHESPEYIDRLRPLSVIKAFHVSSVCDLANLDNFSVSAFLLDSRVPGKAGGSGVSFDWSLAVPVAESKRVILAGGLNPDNVAAAIRQVHPYAVDVTTGVEAVPGRKDPDKLRAFIARAKSAL